MAAAPTKTIRVPGHRIIDGDTVYITGRWQVLTNVRWAGSSSPHFRATTDRGGDLLGRGASMYDIAAR